MPRLIVTEEERDLLARILERNKREIGNPRSRPAMENSFSEAQDYMTPEVHIVRPLASGLAGLAAGHEVSPSACAVYRIVDGMLIETGQEIQVSNLSQANITDCGEDRFAYLIAIRTKFGDWVTMPPLALWVDAADAPQYVLGVNANGCIIRSPVSECNVTGTP